MSNDGDGQRDLIIAALIRKFGRRGDNGTYSIELTESDLGTLNPGSQLETADLSPDSRAVLISLLPPKAQAK